METRINRTMPKELISLIERCGRERHDPKTLIRSMKNCLFMAGIYEDTELVAYGRVCGDGSLYFLITDLMVDPAYADSDLDMRIYKEIHDYLITVAPMDCRILALTDKTFERVLRTFGFQYLDSDYRTVMIRE